MDFSSYKRHCQQLDLSKFNGDIDQACMFYFRLLQELGVEIAATKGQIENLKSMVGENKSARQNNKCQPMKEQEEAEENPMDEEGSHCEEEKCLNCDYKGCDECFPKSTRLALHKMLKHKDPPTDFHKNKVFRLELRNTVEGRRPSRY